MKRFSKEHEWIDESYRVGISYHAQEALGDVVFIDLPDVGRVVTAGEAISVVESVKAASDIYSPVSGTVVEVNHEVVDVPSLINTDPQNEGWIFRIEPTDITEQELSELMTAEQYQDFLDSME